MYLYIFLLNKAKIHIYTYPKNHIRCYKFSGEPFIANNFWVEIVKEYDSVCW